MSEGRCEGVSVNQWVFQYKVGEGDAHSKDLFNLRSNQLVSLLDLDKIRTGKTYPR